MCLSKKFVVAILSLLCLNVAQAAGFDAEKDPFVIGMFGVLHWDEETFAWMEKMGVNYVHSYRLWREENMEPSLDLAAKHNMKVMVDLGAHIRIGIPMGFQTSVVALGAIILLFYNENNENREK